MKAGQFSRDKVIKVLVFQLQEMQRITAQLVNDPGSPQYQAEVKRAYKMNNQIIARVNEFGYGK